MLEFRVDTDCEMNELYCNTEFTEGKLGAIKDSLEKWRFIVKFLKTRMGILLDGGVFTCGLCRQYNLKDTACEGCPIKVHTGQPYCHNTPYVWYRDWVFKGNRYKSLECAEEMVELLEAILKNNKGV